MHDSPIPSTHLSERHHTRAASWGGGLGASYLAIEEHRQTAIARAAQARLLRECEPPAPTDAQAPSSSTVHALHAPIGRILPQSVKASQSSS